MEKIHIRLVKRKDVWHKILLDKKGCELFDKYKWYILGRERDKHIVRIIWKPKAVIKFYRELLNFPKEIVDHKNGNTFDNRLSNLRLTDRKGNSQNRKKDIDAKQSKYKGVRKAHQGPRTILKFYAQIRIDGKLINLGKFEIEELAAKAYDKAALKYFGEFARLNFPNN